MAPKVAVVFYSMYGHVLKLAEAEKEGLKKAGIQADLYQVAETLPQEVLTKMHAPPKSDIPIITPAILETYDAFLFGIPTRYGNFPAQWKTFWDSTGQQWAGGKFNGKYAGTFISTATPGGGQESTTIAAMSTFVHHGIIYVPLGYASAFSQIANTSEVRGGSPWGAGTFAGTDGSRQPTALELELATIQGPSGGAANAEGDEAKKDAEAGVQTTGESKIADSQGAKNGPTNALPKVKEKAEGPCGLPIKCTIL